MQVKLLEGLRLTLAERRDLARGLSTGANYFQSARKTYAVESRDGDCYRVLINSDKRVTVETLAAWDVVCGDVQLRLASRRQAIAAAWRLAYEYFGMVAARDTRRASTAF